MAAWSERWRHAPRRATLAALVLGVPVLTGLGAAAIAPALTVGPAAAEPGGAVLVSRANGPNSAKGNGASSHGRISADGRYVAFESAVGHESRGQLL